MKPINSKLLRKNSLSTKAFAVFVLLIFGNFFQVSSQTLAAERSEPQAFGGEFVFPDSYCLTDSQRAEIKEQLRDSVEKLRAEGKLAPDSQMFLPPLFTFPVRGHGTAVNDFGVHGISNFVDQISLFQTNCSITIAETEPTIKATAIIIKA